MTVLVPQRSPCDCGVACLAMLTGRDYDDVVAVVGDAFDPERGLESEQTALNRLGFSCTFQDGEPVGDYIVHSKPFCISSSYLRFMLWGRRALVTVPSLNYNGGAHMVYFDGRDVFDPSTLKRYERYKQLEPTSLVLFRER